MDGTFWMAGMVREVAGLGEDARDGWQAVVRRVRTGGGSGRQGRCGPVLVGGEYGWRLGKVWKLRPMWHGGGGRMVGQDGVAVREGVEAAAGVVRSGPVREVREVGWSGGCGRSGTVGGVRLGGKGDLEGGTVG
jgi:hypothetical protein